MRPKRRSEHLAIQEVAGELMVLDLHRHRAHCLSRDAAAVWRQCDGTRTVAEIEVAVERELGKKFVPQAVAAIIDEIDRAHLLETPPGRPMSRRAAVAATAGIAASIATMLVPTAALAANSCVGMNGPCSNSSQCCGMLTCSAPGGAPMKVCH